MQEAVTAAAPTRRHRKKGPSPFSATETKSRVTMMLDEVAEQNLSKIGAVYQQAGGFHVSASMIVRRALASLAEELAETLKGGPEGMRQEVARMVGEFA